MNLCKEKIMLNVCLRVTTDIDYKSSLLGFITLHKANTTSKSLQKVMALQKVVAL